jgi:hypothetical protein
LTSVKSPCQLILLVLVEKVLFNICARIMPFKYSDPSQNKLSACCKCGLLRSDEYPFNSFWT